MDYFLSAHLLIPNHIVLFFGYTPPWQERQNPWTTCHYHIIDPPFFDPWFTPGCPQEADEACW